MYGPADATATYCLWDTFTLEVPRWLYDYFSLGVFMIVYNYDADLEVSDTCVRSSLLS